MLASLQDLKTQLGITDSTEDAALGSYLAAADAFAKRYVGRDIEAPADPVVEEMDAHGENVVSVRNYPIISLSSVEYYDGANWQPYDPTAYSVRKSTGQIRFPYYGTIRGFGNLRVTYKWGYETVPKDVSNAVVRIAAAQYGRRNSEGIKREKLEGSEIEYAQDAAPPDAIAVLDSYRSIDV